MPSVFRVAYVDLATASLAEAMTYYRDVLGARLQAESGGSAYLSLGLDHHNIALREAQVPSLVGRHISLEDVRSDLTKHGWNSAIKADARPGVAKMLEVSVGGHTFELFEQIEMPGDGFGSDGVVPNRIGHVALLTPEKDELVTFLTKGLGFWETDWFEEQVTFLSCNRDHHVLNVIQAPMAAMHHLALELHGREHLLHTMDLLSRSGRPIVWGPSRHTAGHNLAAYHRGADGLLIEFYTDMDVFLPALGLFHVQGHHQLRHYGSDRDPQHVGRVAYHARADCSVEYRSGGSRRCDHSPACA